MSELDDLEEIYEQTQSGVNNLKRNYTKGNRLGFQHMQSHGREMQRSIEKQSQRSSDRRRVRVQLAEQSESGVREIGVVPSQFDEDQVEAV